MDDSGSGRSASIPAAPSGQHEKRTPRTVPGSLTLPLNGLPRPYVTIPKRSSNWPSSSCESSSCSTTSPGPIYQHFQPQRRSKIVVLKYSHKDMSTMTGSADHKQTEKRKRPEPDEYEDASAKGFEDFGEAPAADYTKRARSGTNTSQDTSTNVANTSQVTRTADTDLHTMAAPEMMQTTAAITSRSRTKRANAVPKWPNGREYRHGPQRMTLEKWHREGLISDEMFAASLPMWSGPTGNRTDDENGSANGSSQDTEQRNPSFSPFPPHTQSAPRSIASFSKNGKTTPMSSTALSALGEVPGMTKTLALSATNHTEPAASKFASSIKKIEDLKSIHQQALEQLEAQHKEEEQKAKLKREAEVRALEDKFKKAEEQMQEEEAAGILAHRLSQLNGSLLHATHALEKALKDASALGPTRLETPFKLSDDAALHDSYDIAAQLIGVCYGLAADLQNRSLP